MIIESMEMDVFSFYGFSVCPSHSYERKKQPEGFLSHLVQTDLLSVKDELIRIW